MKDLSQERMRGWPGSLSGVGSCFAAYGHQLETATGMLRYPVKVPVIEVKL